MGNRLQRWVLGIVVWTFLLVSCGTENGDGGDDLSNVPYVTTVGTTIVEARPGDEVRITVKVESAPGTPATGYGIRWVTNARPGDPAQGGDGNMIQERLSAGLEQWTFIPGRIGVYTIRAEVAASRDDDLDDNTTPRRKSADLVVHVWGGSCQWVQPDTEAIGLLVGEHRPVSADALAALPVAQAEGVYRRTPSHEPVVYGIQDAAIASVSPGGIVTALAAGDTLLTLRCGAAEATVPLTVREGALAPPAEGTHPLLSRPSNHYAGDLAKTVGTIDGRMAFRKNGYPVALIQPEMGTYQEAQSRTRRFLLAEWTGSGFGTVEVTRGPESKRYPHVVVDENDDTWVLWQQDGLFDVRIAHRSAGSEADEWNVRSMPAQSLLDLPELTHSQRQALAWTPQHWLGIGPRKGGGVVVLYNVIGPSQGEHALPICTEVTRLAEVTAGLFDTFDVHRREFAAEQEGVEGCLAAASSLRPGKVLMPLSEDGVPTPVALERDDVSALIAAYEKKSGQWTRRVLVHPRDLTPDELAWSEPVDMTLLQRPDDPTQWGLVWAANRKTEKGEQHYYTWNLPQNHPFVARFPLVKEANQYLFGLHNRYRSYLGDRNIGPWMVFTSCGTLTWEDTAVAIAPETSKEQLEVLRSYSAVSGFASRNDRFYLLTDNDRRGTDLRVFTLPAPLSVAGAEESGLKILPEPFTPEVTSAPLLHPDRSRHVLANRLPMPTGAFLPWEEGATACSTDHPPPGPLLLTSPGTGQYFGESTMDLTGLEVSRLVSPPFWNRDFLFAVQDGDDRVELMRQKDGVWGELLASPCAGNVLGWRATERGSFFVLCGPTRPGDNRNYQLLFATRMLAGVSWQDLGGAPDGYQGPSLTNGTSVAMLQDEHDTTVVVLLKGPGSWYVHLRRFNDEGTLKTESLSPLDHVFAPQTLLRTSTGDLLAVGHKQAEKGHQWFLFRSTDEFQTHTRYIFGDGTYGPPGPTARLWDGRILLTGTRNVYRDVFKAFYRVSDDHGETFSDPVFLRPEGGGLQTVLHLIQESDKGLLVLLSDNESTRAWQDNDLKAYYSADAITDVILPRPQQGYLRRFIP
jgi:hypothetical protein